MAESPARKYSVEVDLPAEAFKHHPWSPDDLAQELRLLWLVEQVRERRLGAGKAAELARMDKLSFARLLGRHHVSIFDYDDADLDREFAAVAELRRP